MAEHAADFPQATEVPDRGGSFLFEPVGARAFVAPEKFSDEQRHSSAPVPSSPGPR